MQTDENVVQHGLVVEEADVLEGTGDTGPVYLGGAHVGGIPAVEQDGALGGLVDLGEKVKDRGLAGAVGADETGNLRAPQREIEVLHGLQAAEGNAEVDALENGGLVYVALRHIIGGLNRNHRGDAFQPLTALAVFLCTAHEALTSSLSLFFPKRARRVAKKFLKVGLLVASITRISTMA